LLVDMQRCGKPPSQLSSPGPKSYPNFEFILDECQGAIQKGNCYLIDMPWQRYLITAFILFNVIAIPFSTSVPKGEQNFGQRIFMPYLVWTRLNQHWPLFVPTPRQYAKRYRVDVEFRSGRTVSWRRPYPPNWDFFERHLSYSFQKWDLASNYLDQKGPLWNDLESYVQRLYWDDANPPIIVSLVRETADWMPPNETGYAFHEDEQEHLQWRDRRLFTYHVAEKRMD
jgi:hypothetical protein